jgi:hypothetical protein
MIGFRLVAFLISCLLIGSGPALGAQDASFWAFLPEGRVVTRCADGSAPQKEASDKLQQLDERIQELADSAPVANAVGELHELLKTECFLAAAETNRIPNPDTTRSLKEWWLDGYGRDWLESLLVVSKQGSIDHLAPYIGVPPDARKTLNLEAHRTHPLSTLESPRRRVLRSTSSNRPARWIAHPRRMARAELRRGVGTLRRKPLIRRGGIRRRGI